MNYLLVSLGPWIPSTRVELYRAVLTCIIVFSFVAMLMGFAYHRKFDLYRVLRNGIGGGAAFPPAVLLMLYPVSARAKALIRVEAIELAVMIGGATMAVLILYGLLKK